jgi:hypothetical protein
MERRRRGRGFIVEGEYSVNCGVVRQFVGIAELLIADVRLLI